MRSKLSKIAIPSAIAGLMVFIASTQVTNALSLFSVGDVAYSVIGQLAFGISYIIAYIAGVVIAIEAWLVSVVLAINSGVFSSAVVQNGFAAALALANLGFVIAIIVVALATILRSESYGIKKMLGKLIAAAILVNFSLVIMAPIFNFGNSLTQYFLNCVDPAGGGCTAASSGFTSMNDFAKNLAGAFNPQKGFLSLNNVNAGGGGGSTASIQSAFSSAGSDISKMLIPIASIVFVAVQLVMIVVVLGGLIVMLLIRYLYIAILAILMPLAWLAWIFPGMEHHWKKWWSEFVRWTMFAPIVVFFLWLAMTTMTAMNNSAVGGSQSFATYTSARTNPLMASLSGLGSGLLIPIIQNFLNMIIMVGLSIGGMFVANSMGLKGADAVVKGGTKTAKAIGGYTWKQGKKAGSSVVQSDRVRKVKENLEAGRYRFAPKRLQTVSGLALGNVERAGSADLVKKEADYAKDLIHKDPQAAKRILENGFGVRGGVSKERGMAIIKAMHDEDNGKLLQELATEGRKVNGKSIDQFLKDESFFNSYGVGKLRKDAQEKTFLTDDVIDSRENLEKAKAGGSRVAIAAAESRLADAMEAVLKKTKNAETAAGYMKSDGEIAEMVKKLTKDGMSAADAAKVQASYETMREFTTRSAGKAFTAQSFSSFLSKFERSDQLDEYLTRIKGYVAPRIRAGALPTDLFNSQVINWIDTSPGARNLGVDKSKVGLP